jgi:hypothetical protein
MSSPLRTRTLPAPSSVVPGTDTPFQWANLPTFSNNDSSSPQPVSPDNCSTEVELRDLTNCSASHFTEMVRMSVYSPTMLLRFHGHYNTKLDYNFNTDLQLQFQSTFQSYGLLPYWKHQQGEISVPAFFRLTYFDASLTFPAQTQRFPRKVGVCDEDPSQPVARHEQGLWDRDV